MTALLYFYNHIEVRIFSDDHSDNPYHLHGVKSGRFCRIIFKTSQFNDDIEVSYEPIENKPMLEKKELKALKDLVEMCKSSMLQDAKDHAAGKKLHPVYYIKRISKTKIKTKK